MKNIKIGYLFIIGILLLLMAMIISLTFGAKSINFHTVINSLFQIGEETFESAIIQARIPRTLFGLLAGSALAVSGCLMQSVTRNPLADPSLLGVNTGASLFVVIGISFFSITHAHQYIWFAFLGALLATLLVYSIASLGMNGSTPIKLVLAGAAVSTVLSSLVNAITLSNFTVMDQLRFWQTGSIGAAKWDTIMTILPYICIGLIISMAVSKHLNILALGDELAQSLGLNIKQIRSLAVLASVLLSASTTALAGPIGFIGLIIPHFIKLFIHHDMRMILPLSAIAGSILLLLSDVLGRLIVYPSELEVGVITAIIGAPLFIYIVRKVKIKSL